MIKHLVLAAAAATLLAACGSGDDAAAPAPTAAAPAAAAPAAGEPAAEPAAGVAEVKFSLKNATSFTLTHLYMSPAASNDWDNDILGDQVVGAGETAEVSIDDGVESCMYDLRADFEDGDAIDVRGVDVCKIEGTTVTISE
ncbi:MAG: hypothetical protein PSV23_11740 [Brevundimonas sp.]|uniref:hypothetical protein n=1 Tax=Brevundimonas sp. TaxID=1871086 RepID=UPI00248A5C4E|nr:hypothetical protein [Brevundimonas sp.]MDI1327457.1 hypothetical protein [Brevundimonas sp.]